MIRGQHEQGSAGCAPLLHCDSCAVDEPDGPVCCTECGHVFTGRRGLWWEHLCAWVNILRQDWGRANWRSGKYADGRWRLMRYVLGAALTRPSRISTCPRCTHDV